MIDWDGEERRRYSQDHDMLVSMFEMLKSMKENHLNHLADDEKNFNRLYKGQARALWYIAIGIGIISAFQFLHKGG